LPIMVMAEGNETPGGEPPGRTEGDLLAERRARRAMNADPAQPDALIRRAEAAEATVQTLETHLTSLQKRLEEAEDETRRMSELLVSARAAGAEHEHELRRAKQREYAEQRLRVEAEDRCSELDRESRASIERLGRRVSASERDARELASRLESVQRELAEAEQAVAAERAVVKGAERELKERLVELEQRTVEIHRGLEAEQAARERAERQLENMRLGHRKMEGLVRELNGGVSRLRIAATATQEPAGHISRSGTPPNAARWPTRLPPRSNACARAWRSRPRRWRIRAPHQLRKRSLRLWRIRVPQTRKPCLWSSARLQALLPHPSRRNTRSRRTPPYLSRSRRRTSTRGR
jgi:hypothetical protein